MKNLIEKFFKLKGNSTTVKTEFIAGITTFLTMVYILVVNPAILSETGMNRDALFTATALAAIAGTLIMAFWANLPFALAPGMGLNAFFAYTIVIGMGYSWQLALTAVFVEGLLFVLLTVVNVREAIIDSIPMNLKYAISVGIGLFIALIGFSNAEIIVDNPDTLVKLGDFSNPNVWIALFGLILIGFLLYKKVKAALLIGMLVSALAAIPLGIAHLPEGKYISLPPSIEPVLFKFNIEHLFSLDMLLVLFTFLFIDMFDTVGTLIGVASKTNMLDKTGKMPRAKQALFADSIGTTLGAIFGTSTVTTYVESTAGISEGGKTGLTAFVVALFFGLALFFAPVFLMIPKAATAPVLIIVGLMMTSPVRKIDLNDYTEAIPAFLTFIIMPFAMSIAEGIMFGVLSYVILKVITGQARNVSVLLYILSVVFVLKLIF